MKYRLVTLALALAAGGAGAQQMYRCGSTYSQTPCGMNATVVPGTEQRTSAAPPAAEAVSAIEADCREWIARVPTWKDPQSLRIGAIYRSELTSRDGRQVRAYRVMVNAKNSYGGYEGERPFVCYADEAAAKVVDLYKPGDLR